ncbi:phosphotransferase enzyme family protein [Jidongwangia harbinensis]|uniref:phosphotransferase enzyme family protein n=1 Tax=Jidongwangia harbinensis TaxID=2878561 RepID=UPI001CD9596D|nr:phosphotransferase [Jidongwangia harbinensis]MCA2215008.1 phosphotransferase [Jidongwangia harbinensis]
MVRSGDTVRKPWTAATPSVHAYLRHLEAAGFPAAPRVTGRDAQGRQILEYVPGTPADRQPPMTAADLHRLGALVRDLHDVSAGFVPPPGARWDCAIPADGTDLICHQDLAPWNLIRDGDRWVFVDWDAAAPGTRLWDLAYLAQTFAPLVAGGDPAADAVRLRAVIDGYRLGPAGRVALPAMLARRTRAMADLLRRASATGEQPWARLWDEGHGDRWQGAADYVSAHRDVWRQALSGE